MLPTKSRAAIRLIFTVDAEGITFNATFWIGRQDAQWFCNRYS